MKSFLWIKQDDSMQCGAACLAMICRFYGSNLKFTEVAKVCISTITGISLGGIEKAAEQLGFFANSYISTIDNKDRPSLYSSLEPKSLRGIV